MSFVLRYIASSTGAGDGQRFAAFMTLRSGGIRNCSRTDIQNRSSGCLGVCASGAGHADNCLRQQHRAAQRERDGRNRDG